MDTPSKSLAAKITDRLVRDGLIDAEAAKKIPPKLAEGRMVTEDWRMAIEMAGKKEAIS